MSATTAATSVEAAARRIVESSCREQGIEPKITDPVALGKVAAVLNCESKTAASK
jgi:hypothetical protein